MLRILKLLFLGLFILSLAPAAGFAQDSEKALMDLVRQLRELKYDEKISLALPRKEGEPTRFIVTTTKTELLKKSIALALSLNPPPEIPEEATRYFFRGMAAMKSASSQTDFRNAAIEFEKAIINGPWYADAYYNAGVANNKAGNYSAAKNNFSFYLLASPNAPDAQEVQGMIYENEYLAEQATKKWRLQNLVKPFKGTWQAKMCWGNLDKGIMSCNEKEHNGTNWYTHERQRGVPTNYNFEFPGDGTVIINAPFAGCDGIIHGFPVEGSISGSISMKSTKWECWSKDGTQRRQIWSVTNKGYIKISGDRPRSNSAFNPKTRYNYTIMVKP